MKIWSPKCGVLLFLLSAIYACTQEQHVYSADQVYARIVDGDTGKPLSGVVVVAYWELYQGSITGDGMPCGAANVEETVTDNDGKFRLPGWGPVKGTCGQMRNDNPFVYFFKPGYKFKRVAGGIGFDATKSVSVAQVDWNGKTFELHKPNNSDLHIFAPGSYADNFDSLNRELGMFIVNMPRECNWKKIPNMLRAIIAQTDEFEAAGNHDFESISTVLMQNSQDELMRKLAPQCGSPTSFIEGLHK